MRKAVIVGVGPDRGLGAQLCKRFAADGLHVFAVGRTQSRVDAVAADIAKSGGQATAVVADATDEKKVAALFSQIGDGLELAIYNAGNNTPGRLIDMEADYFEDSWRVICFGAFLFAKEALHRMAPAGEGSILFTGASASLRGRPGFGAFNSAKAALRNMAQAMAKEYAPDGVHVGHVVIDGGILGDKIMTRRPDIVERLGEDGLIDIDGIVDAFVYLHSQPKSAWSFELDVRTSKESW
ncbi:MAG: SDR family NAD(P)-dependent oxidoreductase [Hyphomicrobiaceae bacterium]